MKNKYVFLTVFALFFFIVGVKAGLAYNANEIAYIPSDTSWSVTNVNDAINSIYTNLKTVGNASGANILTGYNALVQGKTVSGSMVNNTSKTVESSTVTGDSSYNYISIPSNGYYDTSSKLKVLNTNLNMNVSFVNYSTLNMNFTCPKNTVAMLAFVNDYDGYKLYKNGALVTTLMNANGISNSPVVWSVQAKEGDVFTGNNSGYYNYTVVLKK